jgi:hypothetical protein
MGHIFGALSASIRSLRMPFSHQWIKMMIASSIRKVHDSFFLHSVMIFAVTH